MLPGDTIRIRNRITDYDDSLIESVDSHEIKIYDARKTLQTTITTASWDPDGFFYITYTIPTTGVAGEWTVVWKVTKGGLDSIDKATFDVGEIP